MRPIDSDGSERAFVPNPGDTVGRRSVHAEIHAAEGQREERGGAHQSLQTWLLGRMDSK